MSIKNTYMRFKLIRFVRAFFIIFFILLSCYDTSFSWYSETKTDGDLFLDKCGAYQKKFPVSSYVIYDNDKSNVKCSNFTPEADKKIIVADRVDIDIPLNMLLQESILLEKYMDRLLTVNLRIKKLALDYEVFRKRSEELLKKLRNPLFDLGGQFDKDKKDEESEALKKVMSFRNKRDEVQAEFRNFVKYRMNENLSDQDAASSQIIFKNSPLAEAGKRKEIVSEKKAFGEEVFFGRKEAGDKKLPWIFRSFLKLLRNIVENKYKWLFLLVFISVVIIVNQAKK